MREEHSAAQQALVGQVADDLRTVKQLANMKFFIE